MSSAVPLYIHKAFDQVWHVALIKKLMDMGLLTNNKLIHSYRIDRTIMVKVDVLYIHP